MQSCDQEQHFLLLSTFNVFEMGSKAENSILQDKMQNKGNSLPPTTPVIEGQTRSLFKTVTNKEIWVFLQTLSFKYNSVFGLD